MPDLDLWPEESFLEVMLKVKNYSRSESVCLIKEI